MEKYYLVISFFLCFLSCQDKKSSSSDSENYNYKNIDYGIEKEFLKYVDSINSFKSSNIPRFIKEYHSEIENKFKDNYFLHNNNESRKELIYSEIFERSNKESLIKIKNQIIIKNTISKHDSLIINIIGNVVK